MYSYILRPFVLIVSFLLIAFLNISNYAAPGDIDRSFGNNGFVRTPYGAMIEIRGSAFQTDGKFIIVGGNYQPASNPDFYVIRFNTNGSLDSSFDSDGIARITISTREDNAMSIAVQTDGKIVVVGGAVNINGLSDFAVVRLNSDGTPDTTFDGDGIATTSTNAEYDLANDVIIQPDGKIVAAGRTPQGFALVRYNTDGSIDTSFDSDGIATTQFPEGTAIANSVRLQSDGKIVAGGYIVPGDYSTAIFGIARYNSNGSLDTSFANNGTLAADVRTGAAQQNVCHKIIIQPDNKIVAVGHSLSGLVTSFDFALLRLNTDGSFDNTFGNEGKVVTPLQGNNYDGAREVVLQPDGKLVVGGRGKMDEQTTNFVVMRYNTDGTLDTRFGNNGKVASSEINDNEDEGISSLRILPDGKIFAAGFSTSIKAVFARYLINGMREMDFDGDKRADISIFRPSVGEWWYLRSSDGGNYAAQFGQSTDKLTPADFTGDGKTDIAFWKPSTGEWFILRSEDGSYYSFPFGTSGDVPAPGDFDADGKIDAAVFRPSDSTWYIYRSTDGGVTIQTFGQTGDVPVVSDYDGDGKADIAIYRPSVGEWWIQKSSNSSVIAYTFGNSSDKSVQGDYTGDGKADVAIYRPSSGEWFVLRSEDSSYYSVPFGTASDMPAPGDYDGDGRFDTAVFRPSESNWYVQRSTAGILIQSFGQSGDRPVPNAFVQ